MAMAPSSRLKSLLKSLLNLKSLGAALDGDGLWRRRGLLPVSLLLQGLDNFPRHVILVVLGEHGLGLEGAAGLDMALGDHALPLADQVGHDTLVADRDVLVAVGHLEADLQIVAALKAAHLHHAAEANALSRSRLVVGDIGRRIEKHDRFLERGEHQRHRDGEHAQTRADQNQAALFAGHEPSSPSSFAKSPMRRRLSLLPASALRALAAAASALSRSPSTE